MENNKNKKSVKFQGDMLNFCDFIQVFVFTRNHHLNSFGKFADENFVDCFLVVKELMERFIMYLTAFNNYFL